MGLRCPRSILVHDLLAIEIKILFLRLTTALNSIVCLIGTDSENARLGRLGIDHFNEQPRFGNYSKFVHMKF